MTGNRILLIALHVRQIKIIYATCLHKTGYRYFTITTAEQQMKLMICNTNFHALWDVTLCQALPDVPKALWSLETAENTRPTTESHTPDLDLHQHTLKTSSPTLNGTYSLLR